LWGEWRLAGVAEGVSGAEAGTFIGPPAVIFNVFFRDLEIRSFLAGTKQI
jgi:hypothetical protein